jgi:hypothetical protein
MPARSTLIFDRDQIISVNFHLNNPQKLVLPAKH